MATAAPLTHHEIIALVEPFARQGLQVDLAGSDRTARKVLFKPVERMLPDQSALRETLELESLGTGSFRLTRVLTGALPGFDKLKATLEARGSSPAELLARFGAVAPERHLRCGQGYAIARSYAFDSFADGVVEEPALCRAMVHVEGFTLGFDILSLRGAAADLVLQATPGEQAHLPEDLLAVLGWNWARLVPQENQRWTTRMRLRGKGPPRTRAAEQAVERAAIHLAQVLSEPPERFHDRFVWARWGSVLRRLIPTFTAVGMLGGTLLLPRIAPNVDPGVWMTLHYAPIAIIGVAFMLQELPRFEIPPLPRRLTQDRWRTPRTAAATEGSA